MRTKAIVAAMLALASMSAEAGGQIVFDQPGSFALKLNYGAWSLDPDAGPGEDLAQTSLGLSGFVPIRENLEARYQILTAANALEAGGFDESMAGLGDLRVQLARSFARDRALLSAGLNLPTGKRELDPDGERRIVEYLSRDYLSLPLRSYGAGFGFNLQAGGAASLGPFTCGLSAVYDFLGAYKPYEGVGDYDPGDALSVNATAAASSGRIRYTGDFGFAVFGTDALDGADVYRQSPQFSARIGAALSGATYGAELGLRMILRGRNERYSTATGAIESELKQYGDEFDAFLRVARPIGKDWTIGALAGTRQIMESEEALGRSSLLNLGVDVGRSLSRNLGLDLGVMYYTGSTDGGGTGIGGLQASAGLRVSY